ncbi:hypothetical protein H6F67_11080 [Microcoleus sp. FACHB-1515]|uniref:hypothetical protein n=1 Tax=Cyanophyceae TaxID=3028117 RepID=UPI001682F0B8|nr:hypothetical protein [Microcoleus sp. FACHB-1515]MBD2090397.1 hypothetical protein [Microcoleus sp. FACHB-1515]
MTSDSPPPDRPAFKTPDPNALQSEETREAVHKRYADLPEADLSNSDRISQGESSDDSSLTSAASTSSVDLQMGTIARSSD